MPLFSVSRFSDHQADHTVGYGHSGLAAFGLRLLPVLSVASVLMVRCAGSNSRPAFCLPIIYRPYSAIRQALYA